MLRITLLGVPQIHLHGAPLGRTLVGKELALLAYLAVSRDGCPRARLVDLLWEGIREDRARENLRSLLYSLRQTLGDYVCVTRHAVWLNRQLPYWLDVELFAALPNSREQNDPRFCAEVLKLYRGDFLDGCYLANAMEFEAWQLGHRDHLHGLAVSGWQKLVDSCWENRLYEEALEANRALLHLAPWSEEAHRQRMQMLSAAGQYSAALAQFNLCRQNLRAELDVSPSHETMALYEEIKAQRGLAAAPAETLRKPSAATFVPVQWGALSPPQVFWGRAYELATLQQWLVVERCRVVTVLGQGGEGKSTLTAQFLHNLATAALPAFDAVIVHSWHTSPSLETLLRGWLRQTGKVQHADFPLSLDRQLDLLRALLEQHRILFVIDNFDHDRTELEPEPGSGPGPRPGPEPGAAEQSDWAAMQGLWRLFLEHNHQSALLITARAAPGLYGQPEEPGHFRQLFLDGLSQEETRQLLNGFRLQGSAAEFSDLHNGLAGNPLALKYAAQMIDELFEGSIGTFLNEHVFFAGDIAQLAAQQFACLLPLEQELLTWLALTRRPLSRQQLWANLAGTPPRGDYLAAIHRLLRRSLIEVSSGHLRAKPLIGRFAQGQLLHAICQEVSQGDCLPAVAASALNRYDLGIAQVHTSQDAQPRQLVELILERLLQRWNPEDLNTHLRRLYTGVCISQLGAQSPHKAYAGDNLLLLLLGLEQLTFGGPQGAHRCLPQASERPSSAAV